jgi:alpha-ketoglutarate-dependent taurine dioxygenase
MTATPTRPAVELDVTPLTATIGARIRGADLKQPLDDGTTAAIRRALLDHKVIFFPEQHLTASEHVAFARNFGEVTPSHPVIPGLDDHPEVFEIDYAAAQQFMPDPLADNAVNATWHSDVTFVERPPLGSILNAVVVPPAGGDTQWTNQEAAYEGLSAPMRAFIDGLTAVHSGEREFGGFLARRGHGNEWEGESYDRLAPVEHPVVRTHPETGRRSLFVNEAFTQCINGLTRRESNTLLRFLYDHATQPQYVVRYHWRAGDVAFWDNRVTQHSVVQDFGDQPRVIQRVTIRGDRPR